MANNDGNPVNIRHCGGCINPWNHQATPGKTVFAVTVVALAAIATAVGVLSILSALGYNIHVFNVSLKVLGDLTIYGGAGVTFVSFVIFAVGLSWLITRACCRQNRRVNNPNNGGNDDPENRGNIERGNHPPQLPLNQTLPFNGAQPNQVPANPIQLPVNPPNVPQPTQNNFVISEIIELPPVTVYNVQEIRINQPSPPQSNNNPPIEEEDYSTTEEIPFLKAPLRRSSSLGDLRKINYKIIDLHASEGSKPFDPVIETSDDELTQTEESDSDVSWGELIVEDIRKVFQANSPEKDEVNIHSAESYTTLFKRPSKHLRSLSEGGAKSRITKSHFQFSDSSSRDELKQPPKSNEVTKMLDSRTEKPLEQMGKLNDQISTTKKEELSVLEIQKRQKLRKKEKEPVAQNRVVPSTHPRPQQTQNSAPVVQKVIPNERLLKKLLEKQQAEQTNLSLSNSNNAAQPLQTLPHRNVREIRRPVIAKTGYVPLDLLKEERTLRNQPTQMLSNCPLLDELKTKVEPPKLKYVNNKYAGTQEEQFKTQRESFIQKMRDYVEGFMQGEITVVQNMQPQKLTGKLNHSDQIDMVMGFIQEQITAFNVELEKNQLPQITMADILDNHVLKTWELFLPMMNSRSCLDEQAIKELEHAATLKLPKALTALFIEISKKPTTVSYLASGTFERLEKALGCEENTLIVYSIEEHAATFKLELEKDILSLFERTQDTPLTLVDLEKIKLYIDEEGKAFFQKYNFEVKIHDFFLPLYEFADKFQIDVLALFKDSNTICLRQEALRNIQQNVQEMKSTILEKYRLNIDIEVLFEEVKRLERSYVEMRTLCALPNPQSKEEDDLEGRCDILTQFTTSLPVCDDKIWMKYPLIQEAMKLTLLDRFIGSFLSYRLDRIKDKEIYQGSFLQIVEESFIAIAKNLKCDPLREPLSEAGKYEDYTKEDGLKAQNLHEEFVVQQEQENEQATQELIRLMRERGEID